MTEYAFPGSGYGHGMTLRDYFAGQVLAGIAWREWPIDRSGREQNYRNAAHDAYAMADEMLKEKRHQERLDLHQERLELRTDAA